MSEFNKGFKLKKIYIITKRKKVFRFELNKSAIQNPKHSIFLVTKVFLVMFHFTKVKKLLHFSFSSNISLLQVVSIHDSVS